MNSRLTFSDALEKSCLAIKKHFIFQRNHRLIIYLQASLRRYLKSIIIKDAMILRHKNTFNMQLLGIFLLIYSLWYIRKMIFIGIIEGVHFEHAQFMLFVWTFIGFRARKSTLRFLIEFLRQVFKALTKKNNKT